jgi:hypothetical protein
VEFEIGKVIRREGAPVEVSVSFRDETKPEPQDVATVTVFLQTEETNVFILKAEATVKAQELITHVAGVCLGRGDELLNELILQHEAYKGGIEGLRLPLPPSVSRPLPEIPQHFLDWREGDPITQEHRDVILADIVSAFNLPPDKEAERREQSAKVPSELVAVRLAVVIAMRTGMSVDEFRRTFPKAARSDSIAVRMFLSRKKEGEAE